MKTMTRMIGVAFVLTVALLPQPVRAMEMACCDGMEEWCEGVCENRGGVAGTSCAMWIEVCQCQDTTWHHPEEPYCYIED